MARGAQTNTGRQLTGPQGPKLLTGGDTVASDADRLWTVEEVSRLLVIPVATLYRWRYLGVGPKAGRAGRHLRYLPADVISWLRKQQECRLCGIPHKRHYFASLLIASGADVKTVQAGLRHASAKTTLDTYGHIWPDRDESTRATVDAVIAARAEQGRNSGNATTQRRRSGPV